MRPDEKREEDIPQAPPPSGHPDAPTEWPDLEGDTTPPATTPVTEDGTPSAPEAS